MPDLNGYADLSPAPPPVTEVPAKRKRETSSGVNDDHDEAQSAFITGQGDTIRNIWALLKARDPIPSILEIVASTPTRPFPEDKPAAKRIKSSNTSNGDDNIGSKVQNGGYTSLRHFVTDVEAACLDLLATAESKGSNAVGTVPWKFIPDTIGQDRAIANIKAFTKFFTSMTSREVQHFPQAQHQGNSDIKDGSNVDGNATGLVGSVQDGKSVLTLFANAQGHKQLFSSFQAAKPQGNKSKDASFGSLHLDVSSDIVMPLRENGLPNGIASSNIIPINGEPFQKDLKRALHIVDIFPPPANQPALNRPKTPKYAARGPVITWTREKSAPTVPQKGNYATERLTTGQWLGYSGFTPAEDVSTPEAKRKQRDRTLSTGESGSKRSDGAKAAFNQAKEDALFCSVYSSFAPTRDDAATLVPVEVKNDVWWQKHGCDLFDQTFVIEPLLEGTNEELEQVDGDDTADYAEAINAYVPPTMDLESEMNGSSIDNTLKSISERIQTLYSYQRIRNMSLTSNRRASTSQEPSKEELSGSPAAPSSAETKAYKILRDEIATLISTLPPYAVAKLNGDQLADLNISRKIVLESKDYKGVMEEDITARAAKAAAQTAAAAVANVTSGLGRPAGSSSYTSQKSAAQRGTPQYSANGSQPALARSSSSYLRQNMSSWNPSTTPNYTSSAQRPTYAQTPTYMQSQQTPRPVGPAPTRSAPLTQYIQRAQGQQYSGMYQTPSQPAYQQRAQDQSAGGSVGYYRNPTQPPQQSPRPAGMQYQPGAPQLQAQAQAQAQASIQARQQQPLPQQQQTQANNASPRPLTPSTPYVQGQAQLSQHAQAVQHAQAALRSVSGTPAPSG